MNSIYEYTNYRQFLKDYYQYKKEHTRYFSFRYFSQKAGFSSPSWLKFIINGERNLSAESIERFVDALDLTKNEKDYFRALVTFNQAKTEKEKELSFRHLMHAGSKGKFQKIRAEQFEFYSTWYHTAILQLVSTADFQEDPKWIAAKLAPSISVPDVKKSIKLLQKLGFIKKEKGRLVQTNAVLATDNEVQSQLVRQYHRDMIRLAGEALERIPQQEREISSLTMGISPETFTKLKGRIVEFQDELLETIRQDTGATNMVYQLNFQLFPLVNGKQNG